jgi:hypothetical protein
VTVRTYETLISKVPLEELPKKRGVGSQLHLFFLEQRVLGVGLVWLGKLGAELENLERSSLKQSLILLISVCGFDVTSEYRN